MILFTSRKCRPWWFFYVKTILCGSLCPEWMTEIEFNAMTPASALQITLCLSVRCSCVNTSHNAKSSVFSAALKKKKSLYSRVGGTGNALSIKIRSKSLAQTLKTCFFFFKSQVFTQKQKIPHGAGKKKKSLCWPLRMRTVVVGLYKQKTIYFVQIVHPRYLSLVRSIKSSSQ